jgi:hypothetical protein
LTSRQGVKIQAEGIPPGHPPRKAPAHWCSKSRRFSVCETGCQFAAAGPGRSAVAVGRPTRSGPGLRRSLVDGASDRRWSGGPPSRADQAESPIHGRKPNLIAAPPPADPATSAPPGRRSAVVIRGAFGCVGRAVRANRPRHGPAGACPSYRPRSGAAAGTLISTYRPPGPCGFQAWRSHPPAQWS